MVPGNKGKYKSAEDFGLFSLSQKTFEALVKHIKNSPYKQKIRSLYHSNRSAKR
jgi:hypothetical protein